MVNKVTQFLKEAKVELYKVNWPSKNQLVNYTLMVIGVSVVVAIFLGTLDYFFGFVIREFIIK